MDVVIVGACRTAIGKHGGALKTVDAVSLTIPVIQELIKRSGLDPDLIEDVIWGCNYQKTYKENNLARVAAVKAGLPVSVPGVTVHRNCTSSMSAIQMAYYQIKAGEAEVIMAGGTDSMSNASYVVNQMRWGSRMGHVDVRDSMWDSLTELGIGPGMGITAENLAAKYSITRQEQDELALISHRRAIKAIDEGRFKDEIVPVPVTQKNNNTVTFDSDEHPRRDTTLERLARMKPAFKQGGTVTAGNSSGINDGAAGIVIMTRSKAEELGLGVMASIVATATTGVEPEIMGIGPVSATQKALLKGGMTLNQVELLEVNEAFAAQYLACEKALKLNRNITNVNGSGIALGHPVGCTGARITTTLIYEMQKRDAKIGLATLCAGGGMGSALVVARD
ncbi:MAG: thiolase family protein [Deltaproteobacteria bacterium]|nr:thiolase family protein [Deltaproteobacteria bacterium]